MRLRYTKGGQKRAREGKLSRIIRIMWKRFSDDWSYGAGIKEKPNKQIQKNVTAKSFQPKLATRNDHKEVCR